MMMAFNIKRNCEDPIEMGSCFNKCFPYFNNHNSESISFQKESTGLDSSPNITKYWSKVFLTKNDKLLHNRKLLKDWLSTPHYYRLAEAPSVSSIRSTVQNGEIQFQNLDVTSLLGHLGPTPTHSVTNSDDLEWESEGYLVQIPTKSITWSMTSKCSSTKSSTSQGQSQPSSLNSLEWDDNNINNTLICSDKEHESAQMLLDGETQFLLNEIERLTRQTLNETGLEYI